MSQARRNIESSESEYWVKLHPAGRDIVLAVCDAELIDETFTEGELSLKVYRDFYGGVLVKEEGLKIHLQRATILNLVGERSVSIAMEMGWVDKENVLKIGGVMHAQAAIMFDDRTGKG